MKQRFFLLPHLLLLFLFSFIACDESSTTSAVASTDESTASSVSALSETLLTDSQYVRWIGRTYYDAERKQMFFYHTGTGFTVTFVGTELSIELLATNSGSNYLRPYFLVSVDEEVAPEGSVITTYEPDTTLTLVQGLEYGVHQVTFLKRSEPIDSETAIKSIVTDGHLLPPSSAPDYKVLIIGGSGISGHGDIGQQGQARTTANSDSLQAFGYLVARSMNADFQFVSASGWGLKWGYNPTNDHGTVNIRTAFDTVGIDDNEELIDIPYDPLLFVPDVVVVNIGGNDFSAYISKLSGTDLIEAKALFRGAVTEFVSYLHELYPDALVIWTHTGSQNGTEAQAAIGDLDPKHYYTVVLEIKQVGEDGDPIGADNHASVVTHARNAQIVLDAIQAFNTD